MKSDGLVVVAVTDIRGVPLNSSGTSTQQKTVIANFQYRPIERARFHLKKAEKIETMFIVVALLN